VFVSVGLFGTGFFPAGGLSSLANDLASARVYFSNSYLDATISGYA
jgi:hypothetical protein